MTFCSENKIDRRQSLWCSLAAIPNMTRIIILVQAPTELCSARWNHVGEDHLKALKRELIEELGFTKCFRTILMAKQMKVFLFQLNAMTCYYNPAYIYEVVDYTGSKPLEDLTILLGFL